MKEIQEVMAPVSRPIKILQFGEGGFLRAFVDVMVQQANQKGEYHGNIVVIKPRPGEEAAAFSRQKGLYTVCFRGRSQGKLVEENQVVDCLQQVLSLGRWQEIRRIACLESLEVVVSNTTEAGIQFQEDPLPKEGAPAATFPGKLAQLLWERWQYWQGREDRGLLVLPTELIEENGLALRQCVLQYAKFWKLPEAFCRWMETCCQFRSTLVDRIVTGFPKGQEERYYQSFGYQDALLDMAEPYGSWLIEGPEDSRLPLGRAGLPVRFVEDLRPFREQKVRLLNGAHTAMVAAAYGSGLTLVRQAVRHPVLGKYLRQVMEKEIIPAAPLPQEQGLAFAHDVLERFDNPFIDHQLLSISLNSISKWKARVLPSVLDYLRITGKLPRLLTFSFAALLDFYTGEKGRGIGMWGEYPIRDEEEVLDFFAQVCRRPTREYVEKVCRREDYWGSSLTEIPGFCEQATMWLEEIRRQGMEATLQKLLNEQEETL